MKKQEEIKAQKKLEAHRAKVAEENLERINFAKDVFFPLLRQLNKDIGATKQVLDILGMAVNQSFQNLTMTMKISDLGIEKMISEDAMDRESYLKVLEVIKDLTIVRANNYLGDFKDVVNAFATQELDKKNINEVNLEVILNEKQDKTKVFLK